MIADAFPVLNALREVHLLLAEGANNQYRDLPWTARGEMLMQQWLLARPEFREFLPTQGHGRLPGAVDGPGRRDEEACRAGPIPRSGSSATWPCSASRSCCRSATATGATSRTASRRRTGPGPGGRRCSGTSTPISRSPASTCRRTWRTCARRSRRGRGHCRPRSTCSGGWPSSAGEPASPRRRPAAPLPGATGVSRERASHMLDFTSALYLGLPAPEPVASAVGAASRPGLPAALERPSGTAGVARALAALQGCGAATLATSTLHVFWDLFPMLGGDGEVAIHVDSEALPDRALGVERAACRGVPVRTFRHHDAEGLAAGRPGCGRRGLRPLVVTDGICPGCGRIAPLGATCEVARRHGGRVVVDDTQALGILGPSPAPARRTARRRRLAALAGHRRPGARCRGVARQGIRSTAGSTDRRARVGRRFETRSQTRVHCEPAVGRGLACGRACARAQSARRRRAAAPARPGSCGTSAARLASLGLSGAGGLFPVQTLTGARTRRSGRAAPAAARARRPHRAPPAAASGRTTAELPDHCASSPRRHRRCG